MRTEREQLADPKPPPPVDWPMVVVGVVFVALALTQLFADFDRSLWLDEFGTLWAVEGDAGDTVSRALEFHGQSPFYYLVVWATVGVLGEAEWVLRLPSCLLLVATLLTLWRIGAELFNERVGRWAAALALLHPTLLAYAQIARPYTLATLMTGLFLWGFVRATKGKRGGRPLFVLGGIGLVYAHYLLALPAVGLALAYASQPALRERYRPGAFLLDVALQLCAILPCVPQLLSLRARSGDLDWLQNPFWLLPLTLLFGLLPFVGLAWLKRVQLEEHSGGAKLLAVMIGVHALLIVALSALGTPLLASRYLLSIVLPAALLAGLGASVLRDLHPSPRVVAGLRVGAAGLYACSLLMPSTLFGFGEQEWRGAVIKLEERVAEHPGPVCYVSGFIEDDLRARGEVSEALLAPLRQPGRRMPAWQVVPLTRSMADTVFASYAERFVQPALAGRQRFYYLAPSGANHQGFEAWVRDRLPSFKAPRALRYGLNVRVLVFEQE